MKEEDSSPTRKHDPSTRPPPDVVPFPLDIFQSSGMPSISGQTQALPSRRLICRHKEVTKLQNPRARTPEATKRYCIWENDGLFFPIITFPPPLSPPSSRSTSCFARSGGGGGRGRREESHPSPQACWASAGPLSHTPSPVEYYLNSTLHGA